MELNVHACSARDIVHEITSFVRQSYGPIGDEVLLFCPPEPPLMTSSGYTILHYAEMSKSPNAHPIKTLVMQNVRAIYQEMGDGITRYLILLDAILQSIDVSYAWSAAFSTLRRNLPKLWRTTFDLYQSITLIEFDHDTRKPTNSFLQHTRAIVLTSLSGLFSTSICQYLSDLTIDWVFCTIYSSVQDLPSSAVELKEIIETILHQSKDLLIQLPLGSLDASRITKSNEFLIRLHSPKNQTLRDETLPRGQRFILFDGALELGDSNEIHLEIHSSDTYLSSLRWEPQLIDQYISRLCQVNNINMVLCTGSVPDHAMAACHRHGVVCIPFVEKEDLHGLANRSGVTWLTSIFDQVDEMQHIGCHPTYLRQLRLGGSNFLYFTALEKQSVIKTCPRIIPQVLLRGQSKGICKQYYYAVKKGLRVLRFWCSEVNSYHLQSLGGGGASEKLFAQVLRKQNDSASVLLSHALMVSYSLLRTNLMTSFGQNEPRSLAMAYLEDNSFQGYVLDPLKHSRLIPTLQVKTCNPGDSGVVHPFSHTLRLIEYVLDTLEVVCRLDGIIHVPKMKIHEEDIDNQNH